MANISLSMIVKNEEKYLRECLESVKDLVSEIVIVDTGSTDATLSIAEEYGAKIFDFDWVDDFSAARNFALSKTTGDWVLYLDADERLDEQSKEEVRRRTENARKTGFYCVVKNLDSEKSRDNSFIYVRLFANQPNIEFTGKVHEQIEDSLKKNDYLLVNSKILINHIGYNISLGEKQKKAQRNLNLLIKEYSRNNSPYYEYQLAQTYKVLNDEENAIKYFQKAGDSSKLDRLYRAECYSSLALMAHTNHKPAEAEKLIMQSLKLVDKQPFAYLLASKISYRMGDLGKAEERCKKSYELNGDVASSHNNNNLHILIDPEEIIFYGLTLAFNNHTAHYIKYYQQELEKIYKVRYPSDYERYFMITKKILQNTPMSDDEIESVNKIIKKINLSFFLYIIGNYKNNDTKLMILENLARRIDHEGDIKKLLAKTYDEIGNTDKAIATIEEDQTIQEEDPATLFYLISFYIKKGNFDKMKDSLQTLEKNFKHIPDVAVRISVLKEKLKAFS